MILDTDHISVLQFPESGLAQTLVERIESSNESVATTIVTFEEQMRGWLARLSREKNVEKQVQPYQSLFTFLRFYQDWNIREFDSYAAMEFNRLRNDRVRIASMDLKIASIAIAQNEILVTSNRRDFERVPGLRFESWID